MMYIYVHLFMYISTKMYQPRERIWHKENKRADRFVPICVHIVRNWLVSFRTTCHLGFCLVSTFNGYCALIRRSGCTACWLRLHKHMYSCPVYCTWRVVILHLEGPTDSYSVYCGMTRFICTPSWAHGLLFCVQYCGMTRLCVRLHRPRLFSVTLEWGVLCLILCSMPIWALELMWRSLRVCLHVHWYSYFVYYRQLRWHKCTPTLGLGLVVPDHDGGRRK
jgi:hypothetical protein